MKLALVCQTRTGSQFLKGLLNSHPALEFIQPEVFFAARSKGMFYGYWSNAVENDPRNIILPRKFVEMLEGWADGMEAKFPDKKVVGFDMKIEQMEWLPKGPGIIRPVKFSYLHLMRRNLLRSVVSEQIMYKRMQGGDNKVHRDYVPERETVKLDTARLIHMLTLRRERDATAAALFNDGHRPYMPVYYEDVADAAKRDPTLDEIFKFVKLNPEKATRETNLKKQNPYTLPEMVSNFDKVAATLKGTEFEPMLEM